MIKFRRFVRFGLENFLLRFSYVFAVFAFLTVLFYALLTEVTVDRDVKIAPFVETRDITELAQETFNQPHKSDREVGRWLSQAVSESLSFDSSNYKTNAKQILPYFTRDGFKAYQEYLRTSGIFENLKTGDNQLGVFVEEQPLLLSGNEIDGVYRWLYQVPVTISFQSRNVSDYSRVGKGISRKLSLRLQVTRALYKDDPTAIQIESWSAAARR